MKICKTMDYTGESRAQDAAEGDFTLCHGCQEMFPGGLMCLWEGRNLCPDCMDGLSAEDLEGGK